MATKKLITPPRRLLDNTYDKSELDRWMQNVCGLLDIAGSGTGLGDMLKAVYDPTGVDGSAFLFNNNTDTTATAANLTELTDGSTTTLHDHAGSDYVTSDTAPADETVLWLDSSWE